MKQYKPHSILVSPNGDRLRPKTMGGILLKSPKEREVFVLEPVAANRASTELHRIRTAGNGGRWSATVTGSGRRLFGKLGNPNFGITGRFAVHVSWNRVWSIRGWPCGIHTRSQPGRDLQSPRSRGERLCGHCRELHFTFRFSSFSSLWGNTRLLPLVYFFCLAAEELWPVGNSLAFV